ncbi:tetratricopeptide repeat protein [Methylobacterium sp. JK268]
MKEDEFIREVNEDYRRDRAAEIWKRYSGVFIGIAVLVVIGVGGWRFWQHEQQVQAEAASNRFDQAVRQAKDLPKDKGAEAAKTFEAVAAESPAGYRALARLRAAAELGQTDPAAGAKAYAAIADDTAVGPGLRDAARLRGAMLRLDGNDPEALNTLQGLAASGNAFRHTAREMLGLAALRKGDYEAAGRWFDQIAADRETPQGLRQRLEVYVALVAGGPVKVSDAAPAAPAAPPPPDVTR